jgi:hypothetical protein
MIKRTALSIAILAIGVTPTLAATHYYVEHAANDTKCSVVSKRPDGKTAMAVGAAHKTKALAEAAMKSAAECKA